jgi:transposase
MMYVGVDVHKRTTQLTVMRKNGTIVKSCGIPSTKEGVEGALGMYEGGIKAVLEASYSWGPMYDWLDELSEEVILAHPAKVRAIAEARIKTDKIDSETLAHLLRTDLVPRAHAPSKDMRAVKRVLRQRMFFVRVRTMVKNKIKALLAQYGVEGPRVSDLFGVEGMKWLKGVKLAGSDGSLLKEDLGFLEVLQERIASTEGLIVKLSKEDQAVKWLRSLPGIGGFFSVLIRYEVDDIKRFREAKKFASYAGLVPSTYSSGDRTRHGRLTKRGSKWLRWAFVEAVGPATRASASLQRFYERIRDRRGSKDAIAATARKLTEMAWSVWSEERYYEKRD